MPRLTIDVPLSTLPLDLGSNLGVLTSLHREVEAAARKVASKTRASVRLGKVASTSGQTEAAVYLERGPRVGAYVGLTWRSGRDTARVTVDAGSPRHLKLVWLALGAGLLAGFFLTASIVRGFSPQIVLALGLLAGAAAALGAAWLVRHLGLGMDREACDAIAAELARRVERRLARGVAVDEAA